ncbi:hypothetical protein HJC23_013343 [Cyclotella cryptica]|uniref:Uncharacterized protein n=1 Tax=Cyclotella cryptica TaxID=29204 RepID=A0ABD3P981_9STRA|eukprot:CCRYP_016843-RA/>CCRYP_016843-RA protein AED:0.01 eAED:0.01 QI:376/1/1/1/1/1/2/293/165
MPEQSMPYGSGKPVWARNDLEEGGGNSGLNQRRNNTSGNSNGSYQRGGDGGYQYQPPQLTGVKYAEQQTEVLEDTTRTHVQAETTANTVLATLHAQRQQLQNANEDTWAMRTNVALAQREIKELQQKAWLKKRRLYGIIGLLAFVDLMLFVRIVQCGGSFFCRRY